MKKDELKSAGEIQKMISERLWLSYLAFTSNRANYDSDKYPIFEFQSCAMSMKAGGSSQMGESYQCSLCLRRLIEITLKFIQWDGRFTKALLINPANQNSKSLHILTTTGK